LTRTPAILIDVHHGFLQSFKTNVGIVLQLGHVYVLPNPFQFIIHQSSYHAIIYGLDTDSVVKYVSKEEEGTSET
jgi:hypothetical protein